MVAATAAVYYFYDCYAYDAITARFWWWWRWTRTIKPAWWYWFWFVYACSTLTFIIAVFTWYIADIFSIVFAWMQRVVYWFWRFVFRALLIISVIAIVAAIIVAII